MRFQPFRNLRRIGHALGGENHEKAIAVRITRDDFEGTTVAIGIRIA